MSTSEIRQKKLCGILFWAVNLHLYFYIQDENVIKMRFPRLASTILKNWKWKGGVAEVLQNLRHEYKV